MHTNTPEYVKLLIIINSLTDNQGAQERISNFNLKFKWAIISTRI